MAGKTQQESEAPAKVYQIDALATQLSNIEELIKSQNTTYVTKDALALALQIRDAKIDDIANTRNNWKKAGWVLITIVAGLTANTAWEIIMNTGRVQ